MQSEVLVTSRSEEQPRSLLRSMAYRCKKKKEGTGKNSKPCIPDDENDNMVVCFAGLFSLIIHWFYCQKYEAERNKNESAGEEKE